MGNLLTAIRAAATRSKDFSSVPLNGGGWQRIFESFPGAWQRNVEVNPAAARAYNAVFACETLIASDIAKLRVKLVARVKDDIWQEVKNPAYSPVLRKPNPYQNRIQFIESWVLSKLSRGNTYILKRRDGRGVVKELYVLDPARCRPLVADDGSVWYELQTDKLSGLDGEAAVIVPAREIIHDRFNCLFHPLVGISPLWASGLAATQGLKMQENSANLFANASKPGGLLIGKQGITEPEAARLKAYWDENFTGKNVGRIAVLGGELQYVGLTTDPADAQLIEQLKWTAEVVCSTYHVPPYKIGVGEMPKYDNIQALNVEYYSQCLQSHLEQIEVCLDEGLGTGEDLGTEFDVENLLRMDSVTQVRVLKEAGGIMKVDEMRAKLSLPPTEGGDAVYLQEQNYSLPALAKRDAKDDPFASKSTATTPPQAAPANDDEPTEAQRAEQRAMRKALLRERIRERVNA